ncbi:proteasome activator complex subunit 3-like [Actinia tenebrosa]|uniref:Proteasome activator complex subunit 3-like n=1 Tax=Actinia tenebrosa TaxID=6105 RepID=A0A6P8IJ42_ACTTE|nr:proteasome activator complex subunit 3-like [Actinia tenebrosa]
MPRDKLTKFHNKFSEEAEEVITKFFPEKVAELDGLLKSGQFSMTKIPEVHSKSIIPISHPKDGKYNDVDKHTNKKRKLSHGEEIEQMAELVAVDLVPCNQFIQDLVILLKPNIQILMEKCNMIKMWIQLLIPRIEDGNNFGVSIQEEALSEVQRIEGEAASFLDQIARYFVTRGKIISKVVKYPQLEDYRHAVQELDEKEFISLRLCCCELRNHYLILHDTITKNMEKIKKPRSNNAETLY